MEPFLEAWQELAGLLAEAAGGTVEAGILAGAGLASALVVGKLAHQFVFKGGGGLWSNLFALALPVVAAGLTWVGLRGLLEKPEWTVASVTLHLPLTAAAVAGGVAVLAGSSRLLALKGWQALLWFLAAAAAGAGGMLVGKASLAVFREGKEKVEERVEKLPG